MQPTKLFLLISILPEISFSFASVTTKPISDCTFFPRRRGDFGLCGGEAQQENRGIPFDNDIEKEHEDISNECIKSDQTEATPKQDRLSQLPNELFMQVADYLDTKSSLNVRICSKKILNKHKEASNTEFITQLKPHMSKDAVTLKNPSLSFFSLLKLKEPLRLIFDLNYLSKKLTKSNGKWDKREVNKILRKLRKVDDLENLIRIALMFHIFTDSEAFWCLIDAVLKTGIFDIDDLFSLKNFDYRTAFLNACQMGLNKLGKTVLDLHNENLKYFDGCFSCISNGYVNIFHYTLITSIKTRLISEYNLLLLLEHAFSLNKPIFAQILFEMFPALSYLPTKSIFHAINNKNISSLQLILDHRRLSDINLVDEYGYTPFEKAAMIDFHEGIKVMVNYLIQPKVNMFLRTINTAVSYESLQSVRELFLAFERCGRQSLILHRHYFMSFRKISIKKQNAELLRLVLDHTPKNDNCHLSSNRKLREEYFELINETIILNFIDGFHVLVEYFGTDILKVSDASLRTPFLISALHGNYQFALEIAKIDPEQIHSVDKNGDNALHLALKNLENPFEFIKSILNLNINWEQKNNENEAPIEILDSIQMSPTDIEILYFYFASQS